MFYAKLLAGLTAAVAGAALALWIKLPIPWMLGPLAATMLLRVNDVPVVCHRNIRKAAQWIVGVSLGLHFTPEALGMLGSNAVYILGASLFSVLLSLSGAWLMQKITRVSAESAFFASTIGGASEMTNLAERNGGDVELTAATHSIRVLIVVFLIPIVYQHLGIHGDMIFHESLGTTSPSGIVLHFFVTLPLILLMQHVKIPNPWLLGALFMTAGMINGGFEVSHLYPAMGKAAQLLLGWYVGCKFQAGFFRRAAGMALGQVVLVAYYLLAALLLSLLISWLSGLPAASVLLGVSPGGISEMSITANVLNLGVPLVTAFQVSRLVMVLLCSEPLYCYLCRRRRQKVPRQTD